MDGRKGKKELHRAVVIDNERIFFLFSEKRVKAFSALIVITTGQAVGQGFESVSGVIDGFALE